MTQSLRKLLLFILLFASFVSYEKQAQAAFISPDDWSDLSTWTPSYNADSSITDVYYPTSLSPASAILSTQGINSGILMTSIEKSVTFLEKGSIQFDLDFRTSETDAKGSDFSQSVSDFLVFSFISPGYDPFELFRGNPTNFSPIATCDISDLIGMSGTLYFDLLDQDNATYTDTVISNLAFTPAQSSPVPEPSTLTLLLGGAAIFGVNAVARRRKQV